MNWVPAERVLETVAAQRGAIAKEEARIASFNEYHVAEQAKLEAEKLEATRDLGLGVLPQRPKRLGSSGFPARTSLRKSGHDARGSNRGSPKS